MKLIHLDAGTVNVRNIVLVTPLEGKQPYRSFKISLASTEFITISEMRDQPPYAIEDFRAGMIKSMEEA